MIRTILTEKPDVARNIAATIEVTDDRRTHIEGYGYDGIYYYITWCFGHLLQLHAVEADGKWSLDKLPILPEKFELVPIPDTKHPQTDGTGETDITRRLNVIRRCFEQCDEIVAATDAGREGQAIFEDTYEYLGVQRPVKRLWISSLTEESIINGMENLYDNNDDTFQNLAKAARMRAIADWLVGVNATRAFTLKAGYDKVLSLGRVQTPTFCMICERYLEYVSFVPDPFWYIKGTSSKDGEEFEWRTENRYNNVFEGQHAKEELRSSGFLFVENVETTRKNELPPLLHDLASLQKLANSRYGLTMDETQAAAQGLYEKKLTTYPRTGSRYIPDDIFAKVPGLIRSLCNDPIYGTTARNISVSQRYCKRSVNNGEITDHHAIIITGRQPKDNLSEAEQKVYDLVLSRFLEAFAAPCIADVTKVELSGINDIVIKIACRNEVSAGWRQITKQGDYIEIDPEAIDEIEPSTGKLPPMEKGDIINISTLALIEDKTKPKPLLTDASLLSGMENAGKRSDRKSVIKALRNVGIGTPATRSEIVSTLLNRDYIVRKKKNLIPTLLGLEVYNTVRELEIADIEMTAVMEVSLDNIANGLEGEVKFESDVRGYTFRSTFDLMTSREVDNLRDKIEAMRLKCPDCKGNVRLTEKSAWCPACHFNCRRTVAGKTLSDETMRTLLTKGETSLLSGFVSKKNGEEKEFSAILRLKPGGDIEFLFPKKFGNNNE